MKKVLAIILAIVMAVSLASCGGNGNSTASESTTNAGLDKSDTSNYVGTWKAKVYQLTLSKGGVGEYKDQYGDSGPYDVEWEVADEVLVVRTDFADFHMKAVLELTDDGSALKVIKDGFYGSASSDKQFVKVNE